MKDKQEELLSKINRMNDDIIILNNRVKASEVLIKKYLENKQDNILAPTTQNKIVPTKTYDNKKFKTKEKKEVVTELIKLLNQKGLSDDNKQKVFSNAYSMIRNNKQ